MTTVIPLVRETLKKKTLVSPTTLVEPATCIDLPFTVKYTLIAASFFTQLHCIKFDVDEKNVLEAIF